MPPAEIPDDVRESAIPGGGVLVTERLPHVGGVTIGVCFGAGSRHEAHAEAGLAHFLEHLSFKGTARRTARRISEEIDAVGGSLDAGTGREHTMFVARVLEEHLGLACDLLCDVILNSRMADEDIRIERGVVLDEIKAYEDEPGDVAAERVMGLLYGDDPIARPVLGRREVIQTATAAGVRAFRARGWAADRLLVAAAGRVDHEDLTARLAPLWAGLPPTATLAVPAAPVPRIGAQVIIRAQEQAHFLVAMPALPFGHPDRYALAVLNNLLGGTTSSRLYQEIREERGLAYGTGSWVECHRDVGHLVVHTAADPARFGEVARVTADVLADCAGGGITAEEMTRARDQLKGSMFLGLEGTSSRMYRLAYARMYLDRVTPLDEVRASIEAVTLDSVRALAARLLDPTRFAVVASGPGKPADYPLPWPGLAPVAVAAPARAAAAT